MISHARLCEVLSYDSKTGEFTWRVSTTGGRRNKVGSIAGGNSRSHGYRMISIDGHIYRAHRLAWFYMTGSWPYEQIDHINNDRSDNRFENLREATQKQNNRNTLISKSNRVGLKGVCIFRNKYHAQITVDRKNIHLGYFDCPAAAHFAYQVAADRHFGIYARRG